MDKLKIQNRLLFIITVIAYVIALFAYGFWEYAHHKNEILKNIDIELYNSAAALKYILPDDFHDRAIDEQAISIKEDKYIAHKLTKLIKETGFKYTYTIVKKGDKLFFVASDIAADPETKRGTFYFYPYEEADESFIRAFGQELPTYKTVSDKWGTVRTVMIPEKSPGGINYLACADYDISYVNGVLRKNLFRSIATVLFFLLLSVPIVILYTRQHSKYLASLRVSEEKYRTILDSIEDGYFEVDTAGVFTFFNDSSCKILGYSKDELMGMNNQQYTDEETAKKIFQTFNKVYSTGKADKGFDWEIIRKDGSRRHVETSVSLRKDPDGKPIGFRGVVRDVTQRILAEKAFHREEEKFRVLVEKSPLGVSVIGKDGYYKYFNSKFIEMFGYTMEDIPTGRDWFIKAYPDSRYRHEIISIWINDLEKFATGELRPQSFKVSCKDGSEKEVYFRAVTMETGEQFVTYEDISERIQLEAQLQQAQKMESIGTLAGGIAHNFNNVLMGIQGRASLMMINKDFSHPDFDHLKGIEEYVKNAAELTKDLLGFAREGKYEMKSTDLNALIKHENRMFGQTKKEIRIRGKYEKKLWAVEVDQGQIQQAILNLYVNAHQAMPGGGNLFIRTENVTIGEDYVKPFDIIPGRYVKISVTDTGVGMDEEIREKIFEPFFTTQPMGTGTGLGLASVYGIIKSHGGFIDVYSEKGEGATFSIHLPASEHEIIEEKRSPGKVVNGEGTILFVDDEDMITEVGKEMLKHLGYEVMIAKNGQEAIDTYGQNVGGIDLVILDMVMPGMNGGNTYDQLKKINPEIKVLLSSGYSLNGQASEILNRGCNGFIQKPFNMKAISLKVSEILGAEC